MLLIVGLGNPGLTYKNTYHNVGFMAVDCLAKRQKLTFSKKACKAKLASFHFNGELIVLAKPQTYMNLSGESVRSLADFYKIKPEDVIVIYDDADLPCGSVRIRAEGSGGSHNGMKNIVLHLGERVHRIRVGIGNSGDIPMIDYVLSKIDENSLAVIGDAVSHVASALEFYIKDRNVEHLMSGYNRH